MDYNRLIKNWHTKNLNKDYFSKFVFEYLAFIAFLKKKKFIETRSERLAIQYLKQDESIKSVYLLKIQSNSKLRTSWKEIIKELEKNPLGNISGNSIEAEEIKWWNCSQLSLEIQNEEDKNKSKGIIYGLDDWGNMLEFWCSVRNNLFHGAKDPQSERDVFLVEGGYRTLSPLLEIFLAISNQ